MAITPASRPFLSLIKDSSSQPKKLVIPNFQREFVWERPDQQKLLASFLVGVPVGSLLILKGARNDFSAKELCFKEPFDEAENIAEECEYLLDGQQRISTIKSIVTDVFKNSLSEREKKSRYDNLYQRLKNRWFLNLVIKEDKQDIWGLKWLYFDPKSLEKLTPDDVYPYISYKLDVKGTSAHHSPFYKFPRSVPEDERLEHLSKAFATVNAVPLWELANGEKSILLQSILERISQQAKQDLSDRYNDSSNQKEFIRQLKRMNPRSKTKDFSTEDSRRDAWTDLRADWLSNIEKFLTETILNQQISLIELGSEEIARATVIFENLNRGGTPLSTFDLIVAKAYEKSEPSLRDKLINELESNLYNDDQGVSYPWNANYIGAIEHRNDDLHKESKEQFLNILSLICQFHSPKDPEDDTPQIDHIAISHIKKDYALSLNKFVILTHFHEAAKALSRALCFMQARCGVMDWSGISYKLMLLPIAFILRKDDLWTKQTVWDKLEYWYWLSLFSGRYRERQNERCIEDIRDLHKWLVDNDTSITAKLSPDSSRFKSQLFEVQGYLTYDVLALKDPDNRPPSAIEDGIMNFVLSNQPHDWHLQDDRRIRLCAQMVKKDEIAIEDHHVIPLYQASTIQESSSQLRSNKDHILNSVLNRVYITKEANRKIKGLSPQVYFRDLKEKVGLNILNEQYIPSDSAWMQSSTSEHEIWESFTRNRFQQIKTGVIQELKGLYRG